jgi:hypothetical protein
VESWRSATDTDGEFSALEIGTGWHPVAPLALRAAGATSVITLDVTSHLRVREIRETLAVIASGLAAGTLDSTDHRFGQVLHDALALSEETPPDELLSACGVVSLVGDATAIDLPDRSIDLSVSNNTFEHIPAPDLLDILAEMRRLATPRGGSAHFVDLKDHYHMVDPTIGVYNFLQYSDRRWRWYNNSLHFQNRLRAPDYRRLVEDAGFRIADERVERGSPTELDGIEPASRFSHHELDDLLVHSMWLTLVP